MKTKIFLFSTIASAICLLSACTSEDVQGVVPNADLIRLKTTNVELTNEAQQTRISVEANCNWKVSCTPPSNWNDLTVNKTNDSIITVTTEANMLRTDRTAEVYLTSDGGIRQKVSLRQILGGAHMSLDRNSIDAGVGGGTWKLNVISNIDWTVATDGSDWVSVSTTSGSNDGSVDITVNPSNTDTQRKAVITVRANVEGVDAQTVTITQAPIELTVAPTTIALDTKAATRTIDITSNGRWAVTAVYSSADADWLSFDKTEGEGNGQVTVTIAAAVTDMERVATINVKPNYEGTTTVREVKVTQDGLDNIDLTLTEGDETLTVPAYAAGGITQTVHITKSNANWKFVLPKNRPWITTNTLEGNGPATVTFNIENNTTEVPRTVVVNLTSGTKAVEMQTFTIQQEAATKPEITAFNIESGSGEATISLSYNSMFPVTECGIYYVELASAKDTKQPTPTDNPMNQQPNNHEGTVSFKIANLQPNTNYRAIAYLKSAVGTTTSEPRNFNSSGMVPGEDDNPQPQLGRRK